MGKGPIEPGDAVVTGAGRLPCRHVIHAATMAQDLMTSADLIRRATRSSLRRADALKLASVAFPALGTGVGGLESVMPRISWWTKSPATWAWRPRCAP